MQEESDENATRAIVEPGVKEGENHRYDEPGWTIERNVPDAPSESEEQGRNEGRPSGLQPWEREASPSGFLEATSHRRYQ